MARNTNTIFRVIAGTITALLPEGFGGVRNIHFRKIERMIHADAE
jgi:hypothetical protein